MWVVLLALISAGSGATAASPIMARQAFVVETPEYRIERCAYCDAETWCELRANGKYQCRGCKAVRYFQHFLYPPVGYSLLPWSEEVLRKLYGTINLETGLRQYRRAYISMGKQNGKSNLSGGLPLYHLDCEDEPDAEVCGAAAAKDQAGIVFKATTKLIRANGSLLQRYKILDSVKKIQVRAEKRIGYEVLSADGDVRDGIRPSLLIRDELHRWKTLKSETLRDVTTKGQISRNEPLDIVITTAGAEYESPLWFEEYQFAKLVQNEPSLAPDLFVMIFEADAKRVEEEPGYWETRDARVVANPSHEDLGGHLKDVAIVAELNKARANAADRSKYLRYHLNVPIKTAEDPVIDIPKWQACGGDVDLRNWPAYDYELLAMKWGLKGQPCYAGVDASWTLDLSAVVFVFPPFDATDQWVMLPFFFIPKEQVPRIERVTRMPISAWARQGFIELGEGNMIDTRRLQERIRWGSKVFDLREVPYDRANFRTAASELNEEGITAVEVLQGYMELGFATKHLLGAYPDQKIRHGNNPVLNWMAACFQLKYDGRDNCQPTKPERMKSAKRIDGMQAIVTALNRALVAEPDTVSYTGLRSVG